MRLANRNQMSNSDNPEGPEKRGDRKGSRNNLRMPHLYIQGFFDLALVGKGGKNAAPTIGFRGFCCKERRGI